MYLKSLSTGFLNGDPNDILTIRQVRVKRLKQFVENGSPKLEDEPFFEEILSGKENHQQFSKTY
jgi:hypothetical protein